MFPPVLKFILEEKFNEYFLEIKEEMYLNDKCIFGLFIQLFISGNKNNIRYFIGKKLLLAVK